MLRFRPLAMSCDVRANSRNKISATPRLLQWDFVSEAAMHTKGIEQFHQQAALRAAGHIDEFRFKLTSDTPAQKVFRFRELDQLCVCVWMKNAIMAVWPRGHLFPPLRHRRARGPRGRPPMQPGQTAIMALVPTWARTEHHRLSSHNIPCLVSRTRHRWSARPAKCGKESLSSVTAGAVSAVPVARCASPFGDSPPPQQLARPPCSHRPRILRIQGAGVCLPGKNRGLLAW